MHIAKKHPRGLTRIVAVIVALSAVSGWAGCGERVPPRVAIDAAVDKELALPTFAGFSKSTGIKVRAKYAIEAGGTEALVERMVAESNAPRCDLFWNDGILQTLALDRAGLLRPMTSAAANEFPATARSPHNTWIAIATDARVLVVNTNQVAAARRPVSIYNLTDPQWYERAGIAKPLTGNSATHAACLFQAWGDAKAKEFFVAIKRNARILSSDREVAHAVASGKLAFGLTNCSDAAAEIEAGAPLTIIYPDQDEYGLGTLFIPMTAALVKNSPHPEAADELLDCLLSPEVAQRLAEKPNALVPLRSEAAASERVKTPDQVRSMAADFPAAAERWDATAKILGELFSAP